MATSTEWIVNELPELSEKDREDIVDLIEERHFGRKVTGCRTGDDPDTHLLAVTYPDPLEEQEGEGEVVLVDAPKAEPYRFRYICVFVVTSGGINVYCPSIGATVTISGSISEAELYATSQFPELARFAILSYGKGISSNFRGSGGAKKVRYIPVEMFLRSIKKLVGHDERIIDCETSLDPITSSESPAVELSNKLYRMGLDSDQLRMFATIL